MEWFTNLLRVHPELAIYLTLGLLPQKKEQENPDQLPNKH
jgi:hypothetical protein